MTQEGEINLTKTYLIVCQETMLLYK